ncbi:hypothetical protein R3P38DRAFT_3362655 [Favolaschia claudopus]|uniref:DUF6535 domain-containing protein n=1 Tax=Favolaschia claudopus TaxID=2862362 RepID=A0AAW0AL66_9AGAR
MSNDDSDDNYSPLTPEYAPEHDTVGAKLWSVYVSEAEKYDNALVDSWKSDMEGLLIFAGLFSAILTAFLIESYQTLTSDSGDDIKALLTQISTQLSGIANGSTVDLPAAESFSPPTSSLVCNLLWFISLGLSLSCALIATLVEQWARDFKYKTEMRSAPVIRARIFSYLYHGLKRFNMHAVVEIIPFLLHASLILFFAGLVAFLVPVNKAVMISVIVLLGIVVIAYTTLTVFPLFSRQSPYQTPLSAGLWHAIQLSRTVRQSVSDQTTHPVSMLDAMNAAALEDSDQRAHRDYHALSWTLESVSEDSELEPFLEGIANALGTSEYKRRPYDDLIRGLAQSPTLQWRMDRFLHSCAGSKAPLPPTQNRRQVIALKCLWGLATIPQRGSLQSLPEPLRLQPVWLDTSPFVPLFRYPAPSPLSPLYEYEISTRAVLQLNALLDAMNIVKSIITDMKPGQSHESRLNPRLSLSNYILTRHDHALTVLLDSPVWHNPSLLESCQAIKYLDLAQPASHFHNPSVARPIIAALNALPRELVRMGHENYIEFVTHAARLESPPYQFLETRILLSRSPEWADAGGGVSPEITAKYSNAYNTVLDYQCNEHASFRPHVDTILGILLMCISAFQAASPTSRVSLPSNLSLYLSRPYFDRFKSEIFQICDNWWLCSCLTMELATKPPHVHSEILRAMWEVAANMGWPINRNQFPSSVLTPTHPSPSTMLEALYKITVQPETISLIPLLQTTIVKEGLPLPLSRKFEMHVDILARFIHQASTFHSPPYKMQETMSILTRFDLPLMEPSTSDSIGVSPHDQLNFARNWKTALEHDSPDGFQATMVEIVASWPLLKIYWDESTSGFRWFDNCKAVRVFVEGADLAEQREDITLISRTRLAAIRESLMNVQGTQGEGGI